LRQPSSRSNRPSAANEAHRDRQGQRPCHRRRHQPPSAMQDDGRIGAKLTLRANPAHG